jgi:hypothetical protein
MYDVSSSDMLNAIGQRLHAFNNSLEIARSPILSFLKLLYVECHQLAVYAHFGMAYGTMVDIIEYSRGYMAFVVAPAMPLW